MHSGLSFLIPCLALPPSLSPLVTTCLASVSASLDSFSLIFPFLWAPFSLRAVTDLPITIVCVCGCVWVTQSCPILCNPMDCNLPGSSVHEVLQARILEWVATSFSRVSSRPRDRTRVSCIAGRCFTIIWAVIPCYLPSPLPYLCYTLPNLRRLFPARTLITAEVGEKEFSQQLKRTLRMRIGYTSDIWLGLLTKFYFGLNLPDYSIKGLCFSFLYHWKSSRDFVVR